MSDLFPFVELEFAHAIGPTAGRYVIALSSEDPAETGGKDVLQIQVVGGSAASKGIRRRTRQEDQPDAPAEVPVVRVMWIGASQPDSGPALADLRLERLRDDEADRETLVEAVLDLLNVAVRAHRAAARDPYMTELTRDDPRAVRFGYGEARPLTQGTWTRAFLAPAPRTEKVDRAARVAPSETVALALRGSLDLLESDELVLRATLDLDQQRWRAAALQLAAGIVLLRRELADAITRGVDPLVADEDLERREDRVRDLIVLALADELDPVGQSELAQHVDAVAAVLGRWRVPSSDRAQSDISRRASSM